MIMIPSGTVGDVPLERAKPRNIRPVLMTEEVLAGVDPDV